MLVRLLMPIICACSFSLIESLDVCSWTMGIALRFQKTGEVYLSLGGDDESADAAADVEQEDDDNPFLEGVRYNLVACTPEEEKELGHLGRQGGGTRYPSLVPQLTHILVGVWLRDCLLCFTASFVHRIHQALADVVVHSSTNFAWEILLPCRLGFSICLGPPLPSPPRL